MSFIRASFPSSGLPTAPILRRSPPTQILPMVAADLGVGFVPEEFLQSEDVNIIDLKEKIPERNIVLIKRKEQPLSVAAKELERLIEEC